MFTARRMRKPILLANAYNIMIPVFTGLHNYILEESFFRKNVQSPVRFMKSVSENNCPGFLLLTILIIWLTNYRSGVTIIQVKRIAGEKETSYESKNNYSHIKCKNTGNQKGENL